MARLSSSVSHLPTAWAGGLSGLLFAFAFPPLEWVLLLPFALVPWIVALAAERSPWRALLSGFLFGLAYWCASIPWIVYVVTHYGGHSRVSGIACLLILAAILAEWPAIVAWGVAACAPERSWKRFAAFPLLWMASEHARSFLYGGFPWNLTGNALYRHSIWIQTASVWGVYGVGFLVVAISVLLAAAALSRGAGPLLAALLLVLAVGIAGAVRLGGPAAPNRQFSVAVLQPNIPQEARLSPAEDARSYAAVMELAREAAKKKPMLIVIPESALPVYWDRSSRLRRDLVEIAQSCDCEVLFNDVEEEADRYYNVARLVGPRGLVGKPYRKVHLVPFGEYVPLPKVFFFVRQVSAEIGSFSAAPEPTPLDAGTFQIGIGVCYEITYPALIREQVARGANLLVTISNDSWYGRAGAQAQHFAGAVLRAVETSRYLLRSAITGISGVVDEKGRVLARADPDRAATVRGTAWLFRENTPWTRWGYWVPRVADILALAVLLFGMVRWLRLRRLKAES